VFTRNVPAVREESHLEDMRSAIRGDFERLAERRGEQDLLRVTDESAVEPTTPASAGEDASTEQQRSWFARFVSP
jgi:hypothetical protein